MIFLKICLFSVMMTSGYQHAENKQIVVTGKALNAKGGAVVIGVNEIPYYLEGLESWDRNVYGKEVKVSGALVIIRRPKPSNPLAVVLREQRMIKKPKWELIR